MAEEKFKNQIHSFLFETLQETEKSDHDIINYVQLVGLKKLSLTITDTQLHDMLKEVIKNEQNIQKIIHWICNYRTMISEEQKKKKTQKVKVPEIYSAVSQAVKKNQINDQKKKNNQQNKNQKQETKNQTQLKKNEPQQKSKIFDRLNHQPPIKKKVKTQTEKVENTTKPQNQPEGEQAQKGQKAPNIAQGKTKCKYFPFCKNQQCEFFHPTQKCTFFPKCKFGASCMNVHEICKFKQNCSRPNCFYDHPFKKRNTNPLVEMMKLVMGQQKKPPVRRKKPTQGGDNKQVVVPENKE